MENIEYQIEEAYRSWQQAENLFNNAVTKEEIVEAANKLTLDTVYVLKNK